MDILFANYGINIIRRDAYELIIKLQNGKDHIRKFADKKICPLILNA